MVFTHYMIFTDNERAILIDALETAITKSSDDHYQVLTTWEEDDPDAREVFEQQVAFYKHLGGTQEFTLRKNRRVA